MLYDELGVQEPHHLQKSLGDGARAVLSSRSRAVSATALETVLAVETDENKRELVAAVLQWSHAKAMAKRGGFKATGERSAMHLNCTFARSS